MAKKQAKFVNPLLDALRFISCAQRANGSDMQQYSMLHQGYAVAFDGVVAAGVRINEDLSCCPRTFPLIHALENCTEGYHIAHIAIDRLVVQSGDFQAFIPLSDPAMLQWASPDPKYVVADDKLKAALHAVVGVVNEKADRIHEASVCMQASTCLATDGNVMLEAWHGWHLPPNILLPKAGIKALVKAGKPLAGLGYGDTTVTFWFDDGSWVRMQRFLADWPKSELLSIRTELSPLSAQLFVAAEKLAPFSNDGQLYCWQGKARSHPFAQTDAFNGQLTLEVAGINESRVYKLTTLDAIEPFATFYDDRTLDKRTFVQGSAAIKLGARKSNIVDVPMRGVFAHATEGPARTEPLPAVGTMETWQANTGDPRVGAQTNWPSNRCGHLHFVDGCASCDDDLPF
jgi:hypothetical protein